MMEHTPRIVHLIWEELRINKGQTETWKDELRTLKDCIAVAHADDISRDDLDEMLPVLKERNIKLALEPARKSPPDRKCCTLREIAPIIDGFPKEHIGICFDTAHSRIAGESIGELHNFLDRLFVIHLCDSIGDRCGLPIGIGEVDVQGFLNFLRDNINYNFPIIYERE